MGIDNIKKLFGIYLFMGYTIRSLQFPVAEKTLKQFRCVKPKCEKIIFFSIMLTEFGT